MGPFGAYITLETWGEENSQENPQSSLDQGLMSLLGQLTGINPHILTHIFGGGHSLGNRNNVINDALPPIIEKYVDESEKIKDGKLDSEGLGESRVEIGGVAEFPRTRFGIFGGESTGEGEISTQPKPYLPSGFRVQENIKKNKEDDESVFEMKGGNKIKLKVNDKKKKIVNVLKEKKNRRDSLSDPQKMVVEEKGKIEEEDEEEKLPEIMSSDFEFDSDEVNDEENGKE